VLATKNLIHRLALDPSDCKLPKFKVKPYWSILNEHSSNRSLYHFVDENEQIQAVKLPRLIIHPLDRSYQAWSDFLLIWVRPLLLFPCTMKQPLLPLVSPRLVLCCW
jgi:hypothetical protein